MMCIWQNKNKLLRSQIIIGLYDKNIQTKLLNENFELDQVVKCSQVTEQNEKKRQIIQNYVKIHSIQSENKRS